MFNLRNLPRVTKTLLIINIVVFAITNLMNTDLFYTLLPAFYPQSPNFKGWQIVTHLFMHAGITHLLFNMITLLSFGPVIERLLGEKQYFFFYFACGLGSFVLFNLVNFYEVHQLVGAIEDSGINPADIFIKTQIGYEGDLSSIKTPDQIALYRKLVSPMLGASGAIFGVMTAFAVLYPNSTLIIFPIPIPIKAKYILTVVILGSIYFGIEQMRNPEGGDNIAHFAHLGGALIGYLWIRKMKSMRIN